MLAALIGVQKMLLSYRHQGGLLLLLLVCTKAICQAPMIWQKSPVRQS
jgi:hypothetical protein